MTYKMLEHEKQMFVCRTNRWQGRQVPRFDRQIYVTIRLSEHEIYFGMDSRTFHRRRER